MKRTVLASALSFAVAFGAVAPAFAQDVVINADGTVTVNAQPVAGQTFTAQLPSGEIVTLQAQAVATPVATTPVAATSTAAVGGTTAAGGAAAGGAAAGGAAAGGLAGGVGLAALGALAAVGIIAAVASASDTN